MAFLHVEFPSSWPGWRTPECTLTPLLLTAHGDEEEEEESTVLPAHDKPLTVSVDPKTNADYYSDSPVFRAYFLRSSASATCASAAASASVAVALKFAMRDDLIDDLVREASVYTGVLGGLQGHVVPRCYGIYAGTMDDGQTVACLALEYWGECLRRPFDRLSVDLRCVYIVRTLPLNVHFFLSFYSANFSLQRLRILQQLGEIHKRGLIHGDFAERNVLERNGDIRIIDFDQTSRHECRCRLTFRSGEALLDDELFGCDQLWEVCRCRMHLYCLWTSLVLVWCCEFF